MNNTSSKFGIYFAISLMLSVLFCTTAQAQVEKSGKATFTETWAIDIIAQRFPNNEFAVGGTINGILVRKDGKEFMGTLRSMCSHGELINDLAVGNWQRRVQGCTIHDGDGDIIFVKYECRFDTYEESCDGIITAGTGKFAGITGKARQFSDGELFFRRSCIFAPNPSDCKALYPSALSVPLGVTYRLVGEGTNTTELEWTIP